jgi:hypothetical protein
MNISFFATPISFTEYFLLILTTIIWVLGLSTITQKGKILYFFRAFFERTKPKRFQADAQAAMRYDLELTEYISRKTSEGYVNISALVREYLLMTSLEADTVVTTENALMPTLADAIYLNAVESTTTLSPSKNKYYFWRQTEWLSWKITDPIITCPTCMPSLHGMIVYVSFSLYHNWVVNPLIWVFIAIPSAYFTEQLWKIRKK